MRSFPRRFRYRESRIALRSCHRPRVSPPFWIHAGWRAAKLHAFVNAIVGGAISRGHIPGVEKGIVEEMEGGIVAGYKVVDLEAKVVDGKEHSVDSSELAFKLAARGALKTALADAKPVLLEPILNLAVFVDERYLGDVLSDLSGRRGRVTGQEPIGGGSVEIKAQVPHAELLKYAIELKSMTSGTGAFATEFSHYNPVTGRNAEDIIRNAKSEEEEDSR